MLRNTFPSTIYLSRRLSFYNIQNKTTPTTQQHINFQPLQAKFPLKNTLVFTSQYSYGKQDVTIDYNKNYY